MIFEGGGPRADRAFGARGGAWRQTHSCSAVLCCRALSLCKAFATAQDWLELICVPGREVTSPAVSATLNRLNLLLSNGMRVIGVLI